MRILITGGAGYIGTTLVPALLKAGHHVRVFDNLSFGGRGLLPCFRMRPAFTFLRGDIVNERAIYEALQGVDLIIHLAAIVGYPACKKHPALAEMVNYRGTALLSQMRGRDVPILFASTGSCYGASVSAVCTEEMPLNPLTIYGETKSRAERLLLDAGNVVSLRFATAFGISPRMRLDLLVNDFCYQALKQRNLVIYEKAYKRTFVHVHDIARAFLFAIDNLSRMRDQIYNVGNARMNVSKEEVARKIHSRVNFYLHFAEVGTDEDQRNYEVSCAKIEALGYSTTIDLDEGIDELLDALQVVEVHNEYINV